MQYLVSMYNSQYSSSYTVFKTCVMKFKNCVQMWRIRKSMTKLKNNTKVIAVENLQTIEKFD